jgi:hypothetical protein
LPLLCTAFFAVVLVAGSLAGAAPPDPVTQAPGFRALSKRAAGIEPA